MVNNASDLFGEVTTFAGFTTLSLCCAVDDTEQVSIIAINNDLFMAVCFNSHVKIMPTKVQKLFIEQTCNKESCCCCHRSDDSNTNSTRPWVLPGNFGLIVAEYQQAQYSDDCRKLQSL